AEDPRRVFVARRSEARLPVAAGDRRRRGSGVPAQPSRRELQGDRDPAADGAPGAGAPQRDRGRSGRGRPPMSRLSVRVAVTGLGLVTPVGIGREEVWQGLLDGRSGFAPIESFDSSRFPVHLGAEVRGFDPEPWLRTLDPGQLGRASQLAAAAARMALNDAGIDTAGPSWDGTRAGVAMGTTSGEPREIERFDDRYLAGALDGLGPELIGLYPCHMIAAHVAREAGFAGSVTMIPTACAAGNYAIARAFDILRAGRADVMLAGGADAFSRITYAGFSRLGAIAPEKCQPFDRNRKGMIPGEGAGVLVLEPLERALARGARVYAEVAGYGLSCDAHHMTAAHPEGDGAARAMQRALADA